MCYSKCVLFTNKVCFLTHQGVFLKKCFERCAKITHLGVLTNTPGCVEKHNKKHSFFRVRICEYIRKNKNLQKQVQLFWVNERKVTSNFWYLLNFLERNSVFDRMMQAHQQWIRKIQQWSRKKKDREKNK